MAQEDTFQKKDKSFFRFSDPAGVLAIAFQKAGFGVLTRVSEGLFRVTYPAGKGITPNRTSVAVMSHHPTVRVNYQVTTNTALIKEVLFTAVVTEATLVVDAELTISEILGD